MQDKDPAAMLMFKKQTNQTEQDAGEYNQVHVTVVKCMLGNKDSVKLRKKRLRGKTTV